MMYVGHDVCRPERWDSQLCIMFTRDLGYESPWATQSEKVCDPCWLSPA